MGKEPYGVAEVRTGMSVQELAPKKRIPCKRSESVRPPSYKAYKFMSYAYFDRGYPHSGINPEAPVSIDPSVFDVDPKVVFDTLLDQIPEEDRDKITPESSLRDVLRLVKPAHAMIEKEYFEPGQGFDFVRRLSPGLALTLFEGIRQDYFEEVWSTGSNADVREAIRLLEELHERLDIASLREEAKPPQPTRLQRLLGKTGLL